MKNRDFRVENILGAAFLLLVILAPICGSSFALAQEPTQVEGAEQYLLRPEKLVDACPMPAYPDSLDPNMKGRGVVVVHMTLDSTGVVARQVIKTESPEGYGLADEVTKAVQQWKYKPAYWGGKPVEFNIVEVFYFENGTVRLKDKEENAHPKPEVKVE